MCESTQRQRGDQGQRKTVGPLPCCWQKAVSPPDPYPGKGSFSQRKCRTFSDRTLAEQGPRVPRSLMPPCPAFSLGPSCPGRRLDQGSGCSAFFRARGLFPTSCSLSDASSHARRTVESWRQWLSFYPNDGMIIFSL